MVTGTLSRYGRTEIEAHPSVWAAAKKSDRQRVSKDRYVSRAKTQNEVNKQGRQLALRCYRREFDKLMAVVTVASERAAFSWLFDLSRQRLHHRATGGPVALRFRKIAASSGTRRAVFALNIA